MLHLNNRNDAFAAQVQAKEKELSIKSRQYEALHSEYNQTRDKVIEISKQNDALVNQMKALQHGLDELPAMKEESEGLRQSVKHFQELVREKETILQDMQSTLDAERGKLAHQRASHVEELESELKHLETAKLRADEAQQKAKYWEDLARSKELEIDELRRSSTAGSLSMSVINISASFPLPD